MFLCLDQGGQSTRALVYDKQFNLQAQANSSIGTHHQANLVEHNPNQLIKSFQIVLDEIAQQLGDTLKQITAAGLATQRSSIACWNRHTGETLAPIISWQDTRCHEMVANYQQHKNLIRKKTGLRLSAHYGALKFRWLLENNTQVQQALQNNELSMGPLASYISYHITQEKHFYCDHVNSSRTCLMNIKTLDWDEELLAIFDLKKEILGECKATRNHYGNILLENHEIPLEIVIGDQPASLFIQQTPEQKDLYINIGTGAFIQHAATSLSTNTPLLNSIIYTDNKHSLYALEGTVNGAASAIEIIRLEYQRSEEEVKKLFTQWDENSKINCLFLNGVSGLASPYWQENFTSKFIGEPANFQEALYAVAESIVFLLKENDTFIRKECTDIQQIQLSGGLSNIPYLGQLIADLFDLPVICYQNKEATCLGLASLLIKNKKASLHIETHYQAKENSPLKQRYELWQQHLTSLVTIQAQS